MANSTATPSSVASHHIIDTRVTGLLYLRQYAMSHTHSRRWLAAIAALLSREARDHG
jgi:hypothetical protein